MQKWGIFTCKKQSKLGMGSDDLATQMNELSKQIKSKNDLLVKVEKDYEKGDLSALLYTKHVEKIAKEVTALETRLRQIKVNLSKSDIKIASPAELELMLKSFLSNWDSYPNKSKKLIIRSFLPRIEVDKLGNFYIAPSLPISISI